MDGEEIDLAAWENPSEQLFNPAYPPSLDISCIAEDDRETCQQLKQVICIAGDMQPKYWIIHFRLYFGFFPLISICCLESTSKLLISRIGMASSIPICPIDFD